MGRAEINFLNALVAHVKSRVPPGRMKKVLVDAALNAGVERVAGSPPAQLYIGNFYQTTGALQRPLVTLHNALDPVVPFQHELIYNDLVASAGSSAFLTILPVPGYGHCNFTGAPVSGAFALLVQQATAQGGP